METNEAAEFARKLQWELDRISRDLVDCGITCITLFGEGDDPYPTCTLADGGFREYECEN